MSGNFFAVSLSEMGLSALTRTAIFISIFFFIISFILTTKNMDGLGVMKWMMEKPEHWIGNKRSIDR